MLTSGGGGGEWWMPFSSVGRALVGVALFGDGRGALLGGGPRYEDGAAVGGDGGKGLEPDWDGLLSFVGVGGTTAGIGGADVPFCCGCLGGGGALD